MRPPPCGGCLSEIEGGSWCQSGWKAEKGECCKCNWILYYWKALWFVIKVSDFLHKVMHLLTFILLELYLTLSAIKSNRAAWCRLSSYVGNSFHQSLIASASSTFNSLWFWGARSAFWGRRIPLGYSRQRLRQRSQNGRLHPVFEMVFMQHIFVTSPRHSKLYHKSNYNTIITVIIMITI